MFNSLWARKILIAVTPQPMPAMKNTAAARNAKISGSAKIITQKPMSKSPTINIDAATPRDAWDSTFVQKRKLIFVSYFRAPQPVMPSEQRVTGHECRTLVHSASAWRHGRRLLLFGDLADYSICRQQQRSNGGTILQRHSFHLGRYNHPEFNQISVFLS